MKTPSRFRPLVLGLLFGVVVLVVGLVLARGDETAMIRAVAMGVSWAVGAAILLAVIGRFAHKVSDASSVSYGDAISFTMLPFTPVRVQVAALRAKLQTPGGEPRYGFSRPAVVFGDDSVRLIMDSSAPSEFLAVPRSSIVAVERGSLVQSMRKFGTLALLLDVDGETFRLDLPACDPNNLTAGAPAAYLDELIERVRAELVAG